MLIEILSKKKQKKNKTKQKTAKVPNGLKK